MKEIQEALLWWIGALGVFVVCRLLLNYLSKTGISLFQFFFAFRILPGYTSEVEKGLRQRIIDDELVHRALRFYEEDMKERRLLQRRGELQSIEEPRKVLWTCRWLTMRLRLQKILVKREKRRFWGPVNLARTFGYEVKEKYHDYLPVLPRLPEEEQAALELRASPEP